jgi:YD repeat-containing protein
MRKFALGLAASMLAFGPALAGDPMASRYENTVTLTDASGAVTKIYYDKDGTMKTVLPDGATGTGKWAVKDGKLCVTLDAGPSAGMENCNPMVERKVGDEWELTLADGSKVKVKLEAGRA